MATSLTNTPSSVQELHSGTPDGARLGQSATELIAFWGVTPSAQRSSAAQVALTTALASVTVTGAYGFALSSGFSALLAQVEEIRAALVAVGLLKGS
jgi:hypothetical protein